MLSIASTMRLKILFSIIFIINLTTSTSTSNNVSKDSSLTVTNNSTATSNGSTTSDSSTSSTSGTSDSTTSSKKNSNTDNSRVNSDATISRTTLNNIITSMVNSSSTNGNISYTSSSPPKTLIQYPYQSADQYEIDKLAGIITPNAVLYNLPINLTYSYLLTPPPPLKPLFETISHTNLSVSATNSKRHSIERIPMGRMAFASLSPHEQAQAKLAHLTNTDLKCYVAPPTNMSFEDMLGFWYVVRKVNNSEGTKTDYKYICEEILYTMTGPTTFSKVSDVHFQGKWMTIHGNGTFIPPGIVIIDWAVLDDPSKADRLVFTILGGKYDQWLIGYDCLTGKMRPEVVLQTRHKKVRAKYLNQAYKLIRSKKLPLDDMVCETGFKSSVFSKSHSHTSHDTGSHSSHRSPVTHDSHGSHVSHDSHGSHASHNSHTSLEPHESDKSHDSDTSHKSDDSHE